MDTERTCQRLTQEQIRYLILEADRDAERLKADKYREILETITGEKSPEAAESQAAPALQAARHDALVRCSVAYCCPCLYFSYIPTILETI